LRKGEDQAHRYAEGGSDGARAVRTDSAEKTVRDIRRATRRQYSAEGKIRVVLEGLRGETSIAKLSRKEGIGRSMYYCLYRKSDSAIMVMNSCVYRELCPY
jgi:hypothetical protein